ncbi:MAG: hypothetical protein QXX35_04280 [Desulfurococcaceae archaeon]
MFNASVSTFCTLCRITILGFTGDTLTATITDLPLVIFVKTTTRSLVEPINLTYSLAVSDLTALTLSIIV